MRNISSSSFILLQRSPKAFSLSVFVGCLTCCVICAEVHFLFIFFIPPLQTQFPIQMMKGHSKINTRRKKKSQMYQSAPQMGTNLSLADLERLGKSFGFVVVGFCFGFWVLGFSLKTDKSKNSWIWLDRFSFEFFQSSTSASNFPGLETSFKGILTITGLLFPGKCSSNYPSAVKVAEKTDNFTFGFFLFLLRSHRVSLRQASQRRKCKKKKSICRTWFLCALVSLAPKTSFPWRFQLCKYSLRVSVWQWINRADAAHPAGFNPSLAVPFEGHSLSGDTGSYIDYVVAQVVSGPSWRLLGEWEENLNGISYHGWSLSGI